jgi:pterin-4a-carbinolamine dehydratase
MAILSNEEVQRQLTTLKDWVLVPDAEAADHHPDIVINYRKVTLLYSTHSEGGLTQKDFDGAAMADRKAAR